MCEVRSSFDRSLKYATPMNKIHANAIEIPLKTAKSSPRRSSFFERTTLTGAWPGRKLRYLLWREETDGDRSKGILESTAVDVEGAAIPAPLRLRTVPVADFVPSAGDEGSWRCHSSSPLGVPTGGEERFSSSSSWMAGSRAAARRAAARFCFRSSRARPMRAPNCTTLRIRKAFRRYWMSLASPFAGGATASAAAFLVLMSKASPASVWKIVEPVCSSYEVQM